MGGERLMVGDLVIRRTEAGKEKEAEKKEEEGKAEEAAVAGDVATVVEAEAEEVALDDMEDDVTADLPTTSNVHIITQDDIDRHLYSTTDIVLPLPGTDIHYPTNALGAAYTAMLAEEGVTADMMRARGEGALKGSYRYMVELADGLTWRLCTYRDVRKPLIETDVDKMHREKRAREAAKAAAEQQQQPGQDENGEAAETSEQPTASDDGWQGDGMRAVVLSFRLRSSVYATMLLRELTHSSTSTVDQKQLTEQSEERERNKEREERRKWREGGVRYLHSTATAQEEIKQDEVATNSADGAAEPDDMAAQTHEDTVEGAANAEEVEEDEQKPGLNSEV